MDHAVDFLPLEQHVQSGPVPDIQLVEPGLGVDGGLETGLEIVGHHHVPARAEPAIFNIEFGWFLTYLANALINTSIPLL